MMKQWTTTKMAASATVALVLVVMLGANVRAEAAKLTVKLRDEAAVAGKFVTVEAVAVLSGDEALLKRASSVMLGRKPKGAKGEEIEASFIEDRLVLAGISRKSFVLQGAKVVTVYNGDFVTLTARDTSETESGTGKAQPDAPASDPVPANAKAAQEPEGEPSGSAVDMALQSIGQTVATDLKVDIADIVVQEVGRNIALQRLPRGGAHRLKDLASADLGGPLGRRAFTLVVEIDKQEYTGLVLTVDVARYVRVVVANRALVARQALVGDDLRLERVLFRTRSEDYFTDIDAVLGMAPKSTIVSESVITPTAVAPAVLIKRNDEVTVKAGLASFKAVALDDGARGQRIRIRRQRMAGGESKAANGNNDPVLWGRVEADGSLTIDGGQK